MAPKQRPRVKRNVKVGLRLSSRWGDREHAATGNKTPSPSADPQSRKTVAQFLRICKLIGNTAEITGGLSYKAWLQRAREKEANKNYLRQLPSDPDSHNWQGIYRGNRGRDSWPGWEEIIKTMGPKKNTPKGQAHYSQMQKAALESADARLGGMLPACYREYA